MYNVHCIAKYPENKINIKKNKTEPTSKNLENEFISRSYQFWTR